MQQVTLRGDLAVASLLTFVGGMALGVTLMDNAYLVMGKVKIEQVQEQRRKCMGYLIVTSDGRTTECRSLMPRFDMVLPYQGDPLRLRRREIKRAIGQIKGEPNG